MKPKPAQAEVLAAETLNHLLAQARAAGLLLQRAGAALDESGWTCQIVRARDARGCLWILRKARDAQTAQAFQVEHIVLEAVEQRLTVDVPHWWRLSEGLVAYPCLAGDPAAIENPDTLVFAWKLHPEAMGEYARHLAEQLVHLHEVEPPEEIAVFSAESSRETAHDLLTTAELPTEWRGCLESWVQDDRSWGWEPRLLHGDLHPGHTLVSGRDLSGILDWTDAVVNDPAREFQYLAWAEPQGSRLLHSAVEEYRAAGGEVDATFLRRVAAYSDLKVVEILVRGRQAHDPVLEGAAMNRLRARPRLIG